MNSTDSIEVGTVDRLIADYLAARDAGIAPPADDWVAAHTEHAAELRKFLADADRLDDRLDPLVDPEAVGFVRPGQRFGGFVLVRRLATGGMATVWEAEQEGLRRKVAVKLLNSASTSREVVDRFRREADAAAQLDHPHIVPIHKVGEQDGVPYFVMKKAAADLRQRLDRYTADPRAAAGLLAKVARAVHHAHLHGVLHRDLKPANILLDDPKDGGPAEPLVADFGLAKQSSLPDPAEPTRTGAVLGTPGYMSPEQAAGHGNRGTVLTDVWGLGAVLYAVLAGRPPFAGAGEFDTVRKVLTEEPTRPGDVRPGTDPDLETICLKCLEKSPDRRYPCAAAVADELDRWLCGASIHARPVGVWSRARRWVRRNPYPAALVGVLSLLVVMIAVAAVVAIHYNDRLTRRNEELNWTNVKLNAALVEAEKARDLERHNSALARAALGGYDRIGDSPELRKSGMQVVKRLMYEEALRYYTQFADRNKNAPGLMGDAAEARVKAAEMCERLGKRDDAFAHLDSAIELFRRILADRPDDARAQWFLAVAWNDRGRLLATAPDGREAARAAWLKCVRLAEPLAELTDDYDAVALLAVVWTNLGKTSFSVDPAAGREAFARARVYAERVTERSDSGSINPVVRATRQQDVMEVLQVEAQWEWFRGHYPQAEAKYRNVIDGWAEWEKTAAPEVRRTSRWIDARVEYGELLIESGGGDPLPVLATALADHQRLVKENPDVPHFTRRLAYCQAAIGKAHAAIGEHAKALPPLDAAVAGLTKTTDGKVVFDPACRPNVVQAYLARAKSLAHLGRHREANADFKRAAAADDRTYQLRITLDLAEAMCLAGNHAAAAKELETMVKRVPPTTDFLWAEVAHGWVRCAAAVRNTRATTDDREKLAAGYTANAAAAAGKVRDRDNPRVKRKLAHPEFSQIAVGSGERR